MSHQTVVGVVGAAALVVAMAGAFIAISVGLWGARRAGVWPADVRSSPLVASALLAAMAAALIYQGASNAFPPDFLGAGIFLAGSAVTLVWGVRKRRTDQQKA